MLFSCSPATILIGSHSMQWEVMYDTALAQG